MVATPRNAPDAAQVLAAIVEQRTARLRVSGLADALGIRSKTLGPALEELEASGLVTPWSIASATGRPIRVVTLTALAARQLGIRLDSAGERWLAEGEEEPRRRPWPGRVLSETDASPGDGPGVLASVADPEAEPPDVTLARWEAQVARYERDKARADPEAGPPRIPDPRTLLGLRVQWQGPATCEATGAACPGCRGRHLGPMEACLACHRWGLDHALAEVGEPNRPPVTPAEGATLAERAARVMGKTSPLARNYQGGQAAKREVELAKARAMRLREADARERERLLAERRGTRLAPSVGHGSVERLGGHL